MSEIITKSEARSRGLKHYFDGVPCINGHTGPRYIGNSGCVQCVLEKSAKRRSEKKQEIALWQAQHYAKNKERYIAKAAEWASKNKELVSAYKAKNRLKNKDKRAIYNAKWAADNREHVNAAAARYRRSRYRKDPDYKCAMLIRASLTRALAYAKVRKTAPTFELLGYTSNDLRLHIERQFTPGMTWENHGEWHLDHIQPIILLVAQGVTDPAKIHCLSNLMPIWAKENRSKGARPNSLL